MRRAAAAFLTVFILGILVWSSQRRAEPGRPNPETGPLPGSPSSPSSSSTGSIDPVTAQLQVLLEAARRGDVDSYLDGFCGELRTRLARQIQEQGRDAFGASLREASLARKSHAVFEPELDGSNQARVVVESVYPDRNERQIYRLEQTDDGWRVAEVSQLRSHEPKARFGSLATYEGPEGVPVQAAPVPTADTP